MRLVRWGLVAGLVCLAACGPKKAAPDNGTSTAGSDAGDPAQTVSAIPAYNLGDVEVATRVAVQVAQQSLTQAVQYEELGTLREKVAVANATVRGPRPAEFWIKSTVETRSNYRSEDAVYLKAEVLAEGVAEPLAVNTYVVSGGDLHNRPQTVEFNLAEKLNPLPSSVLLQTKLTIVWFPETSPMSVDAANPDLSKGQVQEKLSNPLRINFE